MTPEQPLASAGPQVPVWSDPVTNSQSQPFDPTAPGTSEGSFFDTPPEQYDEDEFDPGPQSMSASQQIRGILEWIVVAVGALAVALLIKAFLLQAFFIPSGSMTETLHVNDRVLVNKLSYRLHDVNRGDVIVFVKPPLASGDINDLIKRVIALPGETLTLVKGVVYIDGVKLDEPYTLDKPSVPERDVIPGCDNTPAPDRCTIPPGFVFVMGDNRTGSSDSRTFGPIEESSIVGRAFLKVWPISDISFL